jgi:hypothetical protein
VLYIAGLVLILIIGDLVNRRTQPVLAAMAIVLVAVGLIFIGWAFVDGGFGPYYVGSLACGLAVVLFTILAIGALRERRS